VDPITKFHADHNFIVKVNPLKTRAGCVAYFPEHIFMQIPVIDRTYILYTNPYCIEIYTVSKNEKVITDVVPAVVTNIRLLVIQDIFLAANSLGMSKDLIVTNSNKTLFQMLEIPMTDEEKVLETQLCVTFRELLAGNVVTSDIEGYAQVLSCFENGGL
jgi:hypothetical protein